MRHRVYGITGVLYVFLRAGGITLYAILCLVGMFALAALAYGVWG